MTLNDQKETGRKYILDVEHLLARLGSKTDSYNVTANGMTTLLYAVIPPLRHRSLLQCLFIIFSIFLFGFL